MDKPSFEQPPKCRAREVGLTRTRSRSFDSVNGKQEELVDLDSVNSKQEGLVDSSAAHTSLEAADSSEKSVLNRRKVPTRRRDSLRLFFGLKEKDKNEKRSIEIDGSEEFYEVNGEAQGFLYKKGNHHGHKKEWKCRWFRLKDGTLEYYSVPEKKLLGKVDLSEATSVYIAPKSSVGAAPVASANVFQIVTPSCSLALMATHKEALHKWVNLCKSHTSAMKQRLREMEVLKQKYAILKKAKDSFVPKLEVIARKEMEQSLTVLWSGRRARGSISPAHMQPNPPLRCPLPGRNSSFRDSGSFNPLSSSHAQIRTDNLHTLTLSQLSEQAIALEALIAKSDNMINRIKSQIQRQSQLVVRRGSFDTSDAPVNSEQHADRKKRAENREDKQRKKMAVVLGLN